MSLPDDREPYGRLVRETWVTAVCDWFPDPKPSWVESYDETDDFQREADMRIGAAVAARAVEDAKLRNDRLEAQVFALGAHIPAVLRALRLAIGEVGVVDAQPYRAALAALGGGGDG